jgi:hypothetical protein
MCGVVLAQQGRLGVLGSIEFSVGTKSVNRAANRWSVCRGAARLQQSARGLDGVRASCIFLLTWMLMRRLPTLELDNI